jgi:hypothetical protein
MPLWKSPPSRMLIRYRSHDRQPSPAGGVARMLPSHFPGSSTTATRSETFPPRTWSGELLEEVHPSGAKEEFNDRKDRRPSA